MKVWVTRDKCGEAYVSMFAAKPTHTRKWFWYCKSNPGKVVRQFGSKEFKADFGFTPRKGSCKEYELSLKAVK